MHRKIYYLLSDKLVCLDFWMVNVVSVQSGAKCRPTQPNTAGVQSNSNGHSTAPLNRFSAPQPLNWNKIIRTAQFVLFTYHTVIATWILIGSTLPTPLGNIGIHLGMHVVNRELCRHNITTGNWQVVLEHGFPRKLHRPFRSKSNICFYHNLITTTLNYNFLKKKKRKIIIILFKPWRAKSVNVCKNT